MSTDIPDLGLFAMAEAVRQGQLRSVDLVEACLERIARREAQVNAWAWLDPGAALASARQRDQQPPSGPLHGVPIAVKDLCNTEGVPTAGGMAIHRGNVPVKDATVVARLKQAGAVILGKLQMTEGAFGAHHPSIPAPLNPWNATYWTGSSSSGSGSATAAGMCFGSLGSDTGGSIRFPATMNGLSGLKPTWGRVSRAGVFALADSLDHIGPMTRSALDAAIMLGVIAGVDADDPTAVPLAVPDYAGSIGAGVRGKRIGLPTNMTDLDADSRSALDGAVKALRAAGAEIVDVALPADFNNGSRDWVALCAIETALAHEATYPSRASEYGSVLAGLIEMGRRLSGLEIARLQVRRAALTGGLNKLLASLDLLLMPVMGRAVWSLETLAAGGRDPESVAARLRYTAPFDMSGHPTLTLPGGMTQDGVPTGFQIIGRAFDEAAILAAGHAYQQSTDWHLKRPPL